VTRRAREIPLAVHVAAIREHGNGEGHMGPNVRKPLTTAERLDRAFRRKLKGIVGT